VWSGGGTCAPLSFSFGWIGSIIGKANAKNIRNHMAKLFLGLDSSTQSLSAVVIDLDTRKVVYEKSLNFDRALPQYKTQNGVLPNRDPLVKHSSPLLWAAALDGFPRQTRLHRVLVWRAIPLART